MAIKGLSYVVGGKYTNTSGTITYTSGIVIGKAVEYSIDLETVASNDLYADNMIAESDNKAVLKTGTLNLTTGGLTAAASAWLLGQTAVTKSITIGETPTNFSEYVFDDNTSQSEIGLGIIEEHQESQVSKYKTVIFPRVKANIPKNSAKTRGESIEWQTPSIELQILRSEEDSTNYKHPWKIECWHDTEAAAKAYLNARLTVTP